VVDSSPAHAAAGHLPDEELCSLLQGIRYAPIIVVSMAFDRGDVEHDLNGFGMLIPTREKRRLMGVLWSSSIFDGRSPKGKVLIRCMAGGASDPEIMSLEDHSLLDLALEELRDLYGLRGRPEQTWIIRWNKAIAQFEPGHLARLAAIGKAVQRMPGLFLAGSSYGGISINHCVAEAERKAKDVFQYILAGAGQVQSGKEY
jgi:oxygen-dependent protoporphyrinogen oxidase